MAERPQADIDAAAYEDVQFEQMAKLGRAEADLVAAVRQARHVRSSAGLDCGYDEDGEAVFTVQQGLKAAAHGREDAAAILMLQLKILQRMDRQHRANWWIGVALLLILIKLFL